MRPVDIITGTLGKALGGASGGYVASHQEVVDLLRQRSRPYLFSNSVAPPVVAGSMRALELIESSGEKREVLRRNTELFDRLMREPGFDVLPGTHPIRPSCSPATTALAAPPRSLTTCSSTASTSSRSASPSCRAGRLASGSSSRRPIRRTTSARASTRSSRPGTRSAEPAP